MPSTTPNRGYPFPLDPDPLNVAGDIEALARAIDLDFGNIVTPTALDIEHWAADGSWGALTHPTMGGTEYMIMSQPNQDTLISAFTGRGVSIRFGPNDAARRFDVAAGGFNFTGNNVNLLTGHAFTVPSGSNGSYSSGSGACFYRPQDGANNTHISNTTGGGIFYNADVHQFRGANGTPPVMTIHPTGGIDIVGALTVSESLTFPGGMGWYGAAGNWVRTWNNAGVGAARADFMQNGTSDWNTQQVVIQAAAGNAGIGFAVHQASWAVILRANPTTTLAPCLDVMTSDTQAYANLAAGSFNQISSIRFKSDVQPVTDEEMLTRVSTVDAVTWLPVPKLDLDGQPIVGPNVDSRSIGVTAEDLVQSFPEAVNLDSEGQPLTVDSAQLAASALAAVGALARKVADLEARLPAA